MGSQLRRLRAKAGVTGHAHQKRQREAERRKERARLSFQDGNVIVATSSPGGQLRGAEQLRAALESAAVPSLAMPELAADFAFQKIRLEEQRTRLAHILGSHDGAEEFADAIHLAAVKRAQESIHPNHEVIDYVWEGALAELRRGVPPAELSALRKAEQAVTTPPETVPVDRDRRPPAAGMRMSRLLPLLAFAMIGGMTVPPKEER